METPKFSYSDLEDGFLDSTDEHHHWLDKKTGEVIFYTDDSVGHIEDGDQLLEIPEWQRDLVENAYRVLRAIGELPDVLLEGEQPELDRYVEIPNVETHDAYQDMVDFAETVTNSRLSELLAVALRGKGAFRRFKDVLHDFPAERERWFAFENERLRERIEEWARDEGIEIDFSSRTKPQTP